MKLLVFAHFAESRAFLERGKYVSVSLPFSGLWKGKRDYILVGGEGSEAACRAAYVLGKFPVINALYNIGTAAGLSSQVALQNIYSVRTCYRCRGENNIAFHSFTSSDPTAKMDLISSDIRITSSTQSDFLESFAPLADREAHPLARAAQRTGIPFYAFKLVSDIPTSPADLDCTTVRRQSYRYSRFLFEYYCEQKSHSPQPSSEQQTLPHGFYFSTTMKYRYELLKDSLSPGRLDKIILHLAEAPLSPKERGKALLQRLEKITLPTETKKELKQIFSPLKGFGRNISYSKAMESAKFNLQVSINNAEDIQELINDLKEFDYPRLKQLFSNHV